MKCRECNQEFTAEDKAKVNYKGSDFMGFAHKVCPGTKCAACGNEIKSFSDAKRSPASLGSGWMHKGCEYRISLSKQAEPQNDPSSWIVR